MWLGSELGVLEAAGAVAWAGDSVVDACAALCGAEVGAAIAGVEVRVVVAELTVLCLWRL